VNQPYSPEPSSTAVLLVNSHGEYLLHLRDANKPICDPGTWSLVGGGPEEEETLDEAIVREIAEETGLVIPNLAPCTTVQVRAAGRHVTEDHIQVYVGNWDGDPETLPVTEGIMFRWFDVTVMQHLTMCPWAYEVILAHHAEHAASGPAPVPHRSSGAVRNARTVPNIIGVHLFLERHGTVLLGLRHPDSAYAGSTYHVLAGHCEQESAVACLIREAQEEAGLHIESADVEFVHAVHLVNTPIAIGTRPRLQMFFRARRWRGEPRVLEPDKCVRWGWWPIDALPDPTVPYAAAAIRGIRNGSYYTEMGWT
jgi:8-oxo-dGTP diphosphatase